MFQELKALNAYENLKYQIFYYRTASGYEVGFILYEKRGLKAFEVKRSSYFKEDFLRGLKIFGKNYPLAKRYLLYGGTRE